jgi:hypothetical protein
MPGIKTPPNSSHRGVDAHIAADSGQLSSKIEIGQSILIRSLHFDLFQLLATVV